MVCMQYVPKDPLYTVQLYPLIVFPYSTSNLLPVVNILGGDTILSSLDAIRQLLFHLNKNSLLPGPSLEPDGRDINETRSSSWLKSTHLVHGGKLGIVQPLVRISSFNNDVTLV